MTDRTSRYLEAMGIERWRMRSAQAGTPLAEAVVSQASARAEPIPPAGETSVRGPGAMDWPALSVAVAGCTLCGLHQSRKQTVFGVGDRHAEWMVIGEAPGADEDAQGEPFVGRAGRLLNAMLRAVGLDRESVFIANILKCRPPNNRDPKPEEVTQCKPYLYRQIELVKPKVILAVGRVAAQNLLLTEQSTGRLRGAVHRLPELNVPLVVTYHPAYLLRKPVEKRKAWQDLLLAHGVLREGRAC